MKRNIKSTEKYSFATITVPRSKTASALITVDLHDSRTLKGQAAERLYSASLLSGADNLNREQFLNAISTLGASIGVNINNSKLTISLKSRTENFKRLLKLTETMLTSPTFRKFELDRIKSTTINELHEAKEDSKTIALAELRNSLYGKDDRKYSYKIDELISETPRILTSDLKKYHSTTMSQTWTCSIAADRDSCESFEKLVEKLKKNTKLKKLARVHNQKIPKPEVVLTNLPSQSNIDFSIGSPIPITLHHPDYIPLSFGISVLAKWGGFAGRLMSTIRELEGLTYAIYGHLDGFSGKEQGYFRIMTFFAPEKTLQGITSTFRETLNIFEKGITEAELLKFKKIINTGQSLLQDSVASQLSELHTYHCHNFSLKEMEEHKARISSLTLDEVNGAIKTYLNPNTLTISGAGPIMTVKKEVNVFLKSVSY